jgi:cysteinyl-tRNA synthetase
VSATTDRLLQDAARAVRASREARERAEAWAARWKCAAVRWRQAARWNAEDARRTEAEIARLQELLRTIQEYVTDPNCTPWRACYIAAGLAQLGLSADGPHLAGSEDPEEVETPEEQGGEAGG